MLLLLVYSDMEFILLSIRSLSMEVLQSEVMNTNTIVSVSSLGITARCVKSVSLFSTQKTVRNTEASLRKDSVVIGMYQGFIGLRWSQNRGFSILLCEPKNRELFGLGYSLIRHHLLHSNASCLLAVTVTTLVVFSLFSFLFLFFSVLIILTKFTLEGLRSGQTETTLDPYKTPQGR